MCFIHLTFLKQNVPLPCRLGQNPQAHGTDLRFIFDDESLVALSKIFLKIMGKAILCFEEISLSPNSREANGLQCYWVNDCVNRWPFGQMVDLEPFFLIQPEMWVHSRMFQRRQLCPESSMKKVG